MGAYSYHLKFNGFRRIQKFEILFLREEIGKAKNSKTSQKYHKLKK
jgi:hypothetical protein